MENSQKAKFITPPNRLKILAGTGGLPKTIIAKAQAQMDAFEVDFNPEALKLITKIEEASKSILKAVNQNEKPDQEEIILPVMQLKANAGQFKYQLISDVADVCLQFLENIEEFNEEALEVIAAHQKTIHIIINSKLKGDGGAEGYALVKELHQASQRYFKKYKKKKT